MNRPNQRGRLRRALRWTLRACAWLCLLGMLAVGFYLRGALYNRFVRFPEEEAAWAALRANRQPVTERSDWQEYRGVLHSHSEHSHDCEVPFDEILRVLIATQRDFICLSDHCIEGRADFDLQWRGLYQGKLFIPGFEMKEGLMPFGVAPGVVLDNRTEAGALARQVLEHGGVLFYAHPEEPRAWDRPELTGMEIYNLHADLKDEPRGLAGLLPDLLVNQRRYPDHVMRRIFDAPTANLARWDQLNRSRPLTGIAGNDCHQNTGLRARYTEAGTIRLEDTSPETLTELRLNRFTRLLARLCFGRLEPDRILWRVQLDPYERMVRFVTTHLLARELTEPALLDALRAGRAFVGFDMIADSSGFLWLAQDGQARVVMGETLPWTAQTRLRALAPQRCRFTILKDGEPVHRQEGREVEWTPTHPGRYRVEAELRIRGEWTPWVYANPIRLVSVNADAPPAPR
ncbi:MAG: hypothetical protein FJ387_29460 [Verrucomicrobia bacterium]|nr:hypothetical protein [Verrucomicrobiota bacterium]